MTDEVTAAGVAAQTEPAGAAPAPGNPNVPQVAQGEQAGNGWVNAAPTAEELAAAGAQGNQERAAPTVEEVAEKLRVENLARAETHGYRDPPVPSRQERIAAVLDSLEHQVKHNGPITLEMLTDIRALLTE